MNYGLTWRELEVLRLIIEEGHSQDSVAEALFLTRWTVKQRLSSIYRKLNVRNLVEAVVKVIRERILEDAPSKP